MRFRLNISPLVHTTSRTIEEELMMKNRTYLLFSFFLFLILIGFWKLGWLPSFSNEQIRLEQEQEEIPDQAIRLRILANSDSVQDQWIKREVRNAIVNEMKTWADKPKNIDEARSAISERLPKFEAIVRQTLQEHGFTYSAKVELGEVPFPTKLYGNKVYAAGDYEALLITLGEGKGDNWWCVLFPPLCFVDMGSGEAFVEEEQYSASLTSDYMLTSQPKKEEPKKVEVKFFLIDQWEKLRGNNG